MTNSFKMNAFKIVALGVLGLLVSQGRLAAQACREIRVTFQPDCFRPNLAAACNKPKTGTQLDLGPQIAIWLTDETGARYIDTLMVTNLTAVRGLGNRPGRWDFGSSPRFPYGRRSNVLPVWAHARGSAYPRVVMQDDKEDDLGFHEFTSSPDPYYCRPMSLAEVDVDAISCPTAVFNSAKGAFAKSGAKEVYPPRNDLVRFTVRDCDSTSMQGEACAKSSESYAAMNDLDAVAQATPRYGAVHEVRWRAPETLPVGNYRLFVEVNKEFDQNASHTYPAYTDPRLVDSGLKNNIGQPSVVFALPFTLGPTPSSASAASIAGYGQPDGRNGALIPPDSTISNAPGSGEGRLLVIDSSAQPPVSGRVHVVTQGCDLATTCNPVPPAPTTPVGISVSAIDATEASFSFQHSSQDGLPVDAYQIRYREGVAMNDGDFESAIALGHVVPTSPGVPATVSLLRLKEQTSYVVGIKALGRCGLSSGLATASFQTPKMKFKQLEGCFIATAALGSALGPSIDAMRWARDGVAGSGPIGQGLVEYYYRASPPLADLISGVRPASAAVRSLMAPLGQISARLRGLKPATGFSRPALRQ